MGQIDKLLGLQARLYQVARHQTMAYPSNTLKKRESVSSIKPVLPEKSTLEVVCAGPCGVQTKHDVLAEVQYRDGNEMVDWWSTQQIICCRGCETFSFRETTGDSESYDYDADGTGLEYEVKERLYPPRIADARGLGHEVWHLPQEVVPIYQETRNALLSEMPVLAGLGLRTLLEAVCNDQQLTGKLVGKINQFVSKGMLTQARADTLHKIRDLGNDAAHEAKPYTTEQLGVMMGIIEHLLHELYILPARTAQAFNKPTPRVIP